MVMRQPRPSRPFMPGYGVLPVDQGSGLIPWSWAEERLRASHDYWVATVWPDTRPHVMPVWGVWEEEEEDAFWFSSSLGARKLRNLRANPRCVVTTDDARNPVIVEGVAHVVVDPARLERFLEQTNAKYGTNYGMELMDPKRNALVRVAPRWAFALRQEDFQGSPTRWIFGN